MSPERSRGKNLLDALGSGVLVCFGLMWMLACILVVASPFLLMLALAYWLVSHA